MNRLTHHLLLLLSLTCVGASGSAPSQPTHAQEIAMRHYIESGDYRNNLWSLVRPAETFLLKRLAWLHLHPGHGRPAMVFDVDETTLSNYPSVLASHFDCSMTAWQQRDRSGAAVRLEPTYHLYQLARRHHVTIFFLSARWEWARHATVTNLQREGFGHYKRLILRRPGHDHNVAAFKERQRLRIMRAGYHIILDVGNALSDVQGSGYDRAVLLPTPFCA